MREGGTILFDATQDPNIPASAQEVVFVKVNPATQSEKDLYDGTGALWGTVLSKDYGVHTTQVSLDIGDGTDGGKRIVVNAQYDAATETFDNVGADAWLTVAHRIPATHGDLTVTIGATQFSGTLHLDAGLSFASDLGTIGSIVANGCADEPSAAWSGSSVVTLVSDSAGDTASVIVYGISGGVPASETIVLTGTTPAVGATTFSRVHGIYKPATTGNITASRSGPTTFEVFTSAETWGGAMVRTSDGQIEINRGAITFSADGATTKTLLVVGSAGGSPAMEQVTLNGTTPVSTTQIDWDYIVAVFGYEVENARTVSAKAMFWSDDTEATLVSSSTSDVGKQVLVFGKDEAGVLASELVTLNGTSSVETVTAWDIIYGFMLADQDSTAWVGTIALATSSATAVVRKGGGSAAITLVTATAGQKAAGRILPMGWHVGGGQAGGGTTVPYNWTGLTGDNQLIFVGEDEDGAFQAVAKAAGTSGTTTEVFSRIDAIVYEGGIGGSTSAVQTWTAWNIPNTTFSDLRSVGTYFETMEGVTLTLVTTRTTTLTLDDFDQATAVVDASTGAASFYGVGYDVAATLNAKSRYVEVELATTFTGGPVNGSGFYLRGGVEGATAFADWQAALNLLRGVRVNTIVPLTADEAVHAACATHAVYMAGAGRSERDVVLGADSGETLSDLKARAQGLNTRHARLCVQDVVRFNTAGNREQFPPYFTACLAAGMQAGAPVGEPLTHKYLKATSVVGNDGSYTVLDDLDEMIQAGLHVIEPVPNIGYRWARGVTTHLIDDNTAYVEASTNHATNLAVYEFRTALEAAVGRAGFEGSVGATLGIAVTVLGQLVQLGYIVGWRNLDIVLEDDVLTVNVEIAAVSPINFVLSTLHLVPASFAAAA